MRRSSGSQGLASAAVYAHNASVYSPFWNKLAAELTTLLSMAYWRDVSRSRRTDSWLDVCRVHKMNYLQNNA